MAALQSSFAIRCIFIGLVLIQQLKGTETTHNSLGSPPLIINQSPNVYVFETDENGNRQDLTLPCSVGNPSSSLNYTWFREDHELPGSMVNGQGSLVILNITDGEDASREGVDYYCIASDNIGFDVAVRSRIITVYYSYFDGFEQTTENTIEVLVPVALNSDVALECDVLDAKPPPQIKWFNDEGEIQEVMENNQVRFLDNRRYLYLRSLELAHLQQQYYCAVTNANLNQEISAPTRYMLVDNLTQGELKDYKQIGNLTAFAGNTSLEFAYVGGVLGTGSNETFNRLYVNGQEVAARGNVGIYTIMSLGFFMLEAVVSYSGMVEAKRGTLIVNQIPRITSTFGDEREHFIGEDNLTYTCVFEGFPLPRIIFYFNGAPIPASSSSGVIITTNTLTIPSPQVSHSGIYQCIVSNEFGDDQRAWLLEIREPILPQVQPYNFTELSAYDDRDLGAVIVRDNGSTVSFSVSVVADPCPDIVWSLNGTKLGPSNEIFMYNNTCTDWASVRSHNLTFTLTMVLTDVTSGSYSANVTNIVGTTLLPNVYLTIPEPISAIGLSLNETCLKEGSSISIRCNIRGFPRPRIQFYINDIEVNTEEGIYQNIKFEFYDQIVIKNITINDEGFYSCIGSDAMDNQERVTQKFDFCTFPRITGVDVTSNLHIGEPFFIECTVDGIPVPNTAWVKDGAPVENDHNIRIISIPAKMSSRVEVSKASIDDNGEYQCIVNNDAGSTTYSFYIELMQANTVPSLGLIIGISLGVTILILAAMIVILVLACFTWRLYVSDKKFRRLPTYVANQEHIQHGNTDLNISKNIHNSGTIDSLYNAVVPDSGSLAQAQSKADIMANTQPEKKVKNVTRDDFKILVPQNNDDCLPQYNDPADIIRSLCKGDGVQTQNLMCEKRPKIKLQAEQEAMFYSEPVKLKKRKCAPSNNESQNRGDLAKEVQDTDSESENIEMKDLRDNNKPSQVYAFVSAEHKAKKRFERGESMQKHEGTIEDGTEEGTQGSG